MSKLIALIKRLLGFAPPPDKFLTADGAPKPEVKTTSAPPPPPKPTGPKKPFKVLYVITKSNFGGAQRYVYDLATHAPPDVEPVVLCGGSQGDEEGLLVKKLNEADVRTIIVPSLARDIGLTDVGAFYRLLQIFRDEKPDILHLNSSKAGALGALAGRAARIRNIIFTSHGWPFLEKRAAWWQSFTWAASIATILLSHKIICVSRYDLNEFRGWFFQNKLVAIHNGIPPTDYYEREDARRDLVPHSELFHGDVWVGFIGELNQNKNVELALNAVAKALASGCKIFFAIVGDGDERIELEDKAFDLKLGQNVKFVGFLAEAQRYMKAFDIFLMTSRKEGLPYVILEAERAGIPILAPAVGGIPEIIREGENGLLFTSEDVEDLSQKLITLCKDQELRVSLSNKPVPDTFHSMLRETFALYRVPKADGLETN